MSKYVTTFHLLAELDFRAKCAMSVQQSKRPEGGGSANAINSISKVDLQDTEAALRGLIAFSSRESAS